MSKNRGLQRGSLVEYHRAPRRHHLRLPPESPIALHQPGRQDPRQQLRQVQSHGIRDERLGPRPQPNRQRRREAGARAERPQARRRERLHPARRGQRQVGQGLPAGRGRRRELRLGHPRRQGRLRGQSLPMSSRSCVVGFARARCIKVFIKPLFNSYSCLSF